MLVAIAWPDVVADYAPVVQTLGGALVGAAATYFAGKTSWQREQQQRREEAERGKQEQEAIERRQRYEAATQRLTEAFAAFRVALLGAVAASRVARQRSAGDRDPEYLAALADASDKGYTLYFVASHQGTRDEVYRIIDWMVTGEMFEFNDAFWSAVENVKLLSSLVERELHDRLLAT